MDILGKSYVIKHKVELTDNNLNRFWPYPLLYAAWDNLKKIYI